tara:strand:- start:826 stop:1725 length:900 start_codon:yes stop_codon:yes gene_type:complete
MFKSSLTTGILTAALATTLSTPSLAAEGSEDFYVGGTAVVLLEDSFSAPAGANVLGANLPFPGNPFTPIMNVGPVPLYDATSILAGNPTPTNVIMTSSKVENKDGTISVTCIIQTTDGEPFVTESTPLTVQTLTGPQQANRFVIDFGNGYANPAFPVNGADGCGEPGSLGTISVDYFHTKLNGEELYETGDAPAAVSDIGGFTFGWGFLINGDTNNDGSNDGADNFNRCGFIATFTPIESNPCPDCPDLNGDCVVDGADLAGLLAAWGDSGVPADFDQSGSVDGADLAALLAAWGACEP